MTTFAYCSLTDIKNELRIADTNSDSVLQSFIYVASDAINDYCGTWFQPTIDTFNYDYKQSVDKFNGLLNLNRDIVALSGVTFDDTAQTLSDFRLSPANQYPANYIYGTEWTYNEPDDIAIAGTWCYHDRYNTAWLLQATLGTALSDTTTTTIDVSSTGLYVGELLKIDSELLQITDVTGGVITAERGANGSTAATHEIGATVEYFKPMRVVSQACARWAGFMFTRRSGYESYTFQPDGAVVNYPSDMPADVAGLLKRIKTGLRISTV